MVEFREYQQVQELSQGGSTATRSRPQPRFNVEVWVVVDRVVFLPRHEERQKTDDIRGVAGIVFVPRDIEQFRIPGGQRSGKVVAEGVADGSIDNPGIGQLGGCIRRRPLYASTRRAN